MNEKNSLADRPGFSLTLSALLRRLVRQKALFLVILLLTLLITVLLTWMMTPSYRSFSTLQIEKQGAQIVDFGKLNKPTPDLGELDPFFRTQYEQLKSRTLAARVIAKLNLEQRLFAKDFRTPLRKAVTERLNFMFTPLQAQWQTWLNQWFPTEKPLAGKPDRVGEFLEMLYLEPVEKTHLVKVFFRSPDSVLSAEVVNTLVSTYIRETLTEDSQTDTYAQTFLDLELDKARTRLTNSEDELVRYARDNEILEVNNSQSTQEQKLTELNKALVGAEQQRIQAQSQLEQAKKHGSVSNILANPVIATLKQQLATLEANYQKQGKIFKPAYPEMQSLAREIQSVRRKISTETARVKQSLAADFSSATHLENRMRSELASYRDELINLRDRGVEYNALQREVDTNRQLYENLLKRMKEVSVAAGDSGSNVRIVDQAVPAEKSFRPNKSLNLLLGLVAGTLLAAGLALLRESMSKTIESSGELQALSGLPVLGTIPYVRKRNDRILSLAAFREVGSPIAEAYRIAAANLKFANVDGGMPRILLLTSIHPAEGKSTSSVNLALSHAQLGHKVLLIDADLRRPTLHEKTGLDNRVGLSEYLHGDVELAKATQQLPETQNGYVITAGQLNLDPVEALSSQQLEQLIAMSAQHFDITILDAPPLTGFADSLLLASLSDATLMVLSEDSIERDQLSDALRQVQRVKQNVIGFLVVKARNNVVSEQYYERYARNRQRIERPVLVPAALHKDGLNLIKH